MDTAVFFLPWLAITESATGTASCAGSVLLVLDNSGQKPTSQPI
jgi:hypothetical protein